MTRLRWIGLAATVVVLVLGVTYAAKPVWYLRMVYPLRFPKTIQTHAENNDLPPGLVAAVIMHESGFDPTVKSAAGAVGLMQLTPDTAQGIAKRTGGSKFETADLLDPEINIRYGSWYLNHLHQSFQHEGEGYVATLAAYNAGQGRVRSWLKKDEDGKLEIDEIPFAETREYVRKVTTTRDYYERAYARELGSK